MSPVGRSALAISLSLALSVGLMTPAKADSIETLKTLVEQQRYQEAYQLANQMIDEWAGDPAFDLLMGMAALTNSKEQEAVFAFERVILQRPKFNRARLLSAGAYLKLENYDAAKRELDQLATNNLTEQQHELVANYRQKVVNLQPIINCWMLPTSIVLPLTDS